ncbi:ferric reductase NAD binding domain-domain-containing protein [Kockovaella imperatae]|uniref:Ferric reductase NAD binding domain-domain-containing protein n=1 Tax=Kockovaella imperatae TaxID=4999 RepID=A0A1Y1UCL1_9TREE|nr:ferric reductase NAD binding domain-domain-containing protein [Kockovaella imperatae]ORX35783.1 ferric reductase NAD binding domain-domain-containing protein [Kockovaella imperatae]
MTSSSLPPSIRRELTGKKLVWHLSWNGLHLGLFALGWWSQWSNQRLAALNGLRYSVWTSRGAGLVLAFDGTIILLPMLRNLIKLLRPQLSWLIPLDESIWFHRQVAYQLLIYAIVHTTAHYVNFINVERTQVRKQTAWEIHYTQPGGFTGHVMLLIMLLMYTTAHKTIRQRCFEAFWYTHHLAFFFMIGFYTHATGCFVRDSVDPDYVAVFPFYSTNHCLGYESWRFAIWGGILYFSERVWREVRSRRQTAITNVKIHPSGALELRFVKPSMKYKAGQWLFLNCPEVSKWQWHPFTISSAPEDPFISVHIRQVGDFTQALGARLGATVGVSGESLMDSEKGGRRGDWIEISPAMGKPMPLLRIDGPFGAPAEDVFKSEVAVLIGAGIGVTPFASILKHIWYAQRAGKLGALRRVEFIWSCREAGSFGWFQSLLEEIEEAQTDSNFLRMSIYLTQKMDSDAVQNIVINSVGQEYDPLTLLRTRTLFGRPDFQQIFSALAASINGGSYLVGREATLKTRLGVYYCGPNPLARVIQAEAMKCKSDTIDVKFAKEHF